jgi:hypothetical protein
MTLDQNGSSKILIKISLFSKTMNENERNRISNFTMNNTTQNNRRSRSNSILQTFQSHTICLAMALLMLSTSASAFSEVGRRSNVPSNSAIRRKTTMSYTNSQASLESENASRSSRREGQVPISTTTTTQLQFRDGDHGDTVARRLEHDAASSPEAQGRWWQTVFSTAPVPDDTVDSEQAVVDDYLEFLNRRYRRLHGEVKQKEVNFSAWKWLMQDEVEGSEDQSFTTPEEKKENAFYALGVAGLASQRLLQKHQPATPTQTSAVTRKVESKPQGFAVDAEMTVLPSTRLSVVAAMAVAGVTPILEQLSRQRRALLRFQTLKLRAVLKFLVRKVPSASIKAVKSVIRRGGGKQNIAMTLTVTAALTFVLLRPLVQAVFIGEHQ